MEWLEPSIENRVNELFNDIWENDEVINVVKQRIIDVINSTENKSLTESMLELENIIILRIRHAVDVSYREGLKNGLKLAQS